MNGAYVVATGGKVGIPFNDDYASKGHEYFDVWAPEIASHYGEVSPPCFRSLAARRMYPGVRPPRPS